MIFQLVMSSIIIFVAYVLIIQGLSVNFSSDRSLKEQFVLIEFLITFSVIILFCLSSIFIINNNYRSKYEKQYTYHFSQNLYSINCIWIFV